MARLRGARAALALAAGALAAGCGHDPPAPPRHATIHVVRPGETVWRIAQRHGVSVEDVVRLNGIRDVTELPEGTRLWIPRPSLPAPGAAAWPPAAGPSTVHVVRPGETVWRIARRYGVSVEDVVRANGIRDVTDVPVGARLAIPAPGAPRIALPPGAGAVEGGASGGARPETGLALAWPVRGTLTSRFGRRGGRVHEGIDLSAPSGTPVRAAEAGRVIYSGNKFGAYGNVVVVRHTGPYKTIYAHNRRNLVRYGDFVERGAVIAEVGSSGNASGPHLHFEVRHGHRPVDPLAHLP